MHAQATVRVWLGSRPANQFIRAAGLGINGQYAPDVWKIDYKPGEIVTVDRVNKTMESVKSEADRLGESMEISRWEVLSIVDVQ